MIEEHGRVYNYRAIVAPTSTNTAKAIDEFGDTTKRTPSAGVAAFLSPELAKRVRGPAEKLASGRVLHFTLGDGESPAQDRSPTHVVVVYGLSGESSKSGARAALAKNVAKELTGILENPAFKEHRFLIYADANSVTTGSDRASGKMNEADHTPYSVSRILNRQDMTDTMKEAYGGDPPMTYFGKDKAPTSRIDLICTKNMGPFSAATARGPAGISATHAALGIAFTDEVHKPKTQNRTSQDAIDHVVAYMADCGGRTWSLNDKKTKQYTALCSKDSGSETRKKIEAAIHMQQTPHENTQCNNRASRHKHR
jgi:hypothetical protein